tara:strand:+ start:13738 stop:14601 length:864 start_codon:yes stop_codon:yes gene_type:complete
MKECKKLELTFIIDLKSPISIKELITIHNLILINNKGINFYKFIYVCCQNIKEDIKINKLNNNVSLLKTKDPGVISTREDNFKMKNSRRMFSKLLNASNHVTTDHIIYLRLDLISDYKKLNNMIDDLRLLKKDKKAILLYQNKSTICNSLMDWFYAGKNLYFREALKKSINILNNEYEKDKLIHFRSNEQIFYIGSGLKNQNTSLLGLVLSDLLIIKNYKLFHRIKYKYQNKNMPLKISLDDIFFFFPFELAIFLSPFRFLSCFIKLFNKKGSNRLYEFGVPKFSGN